MQGWIKLHRQIVNSDIYVMPPLYLRVFERLIIEANHADKEIPYKFPGESVTTKKLIKRGERLTSLRQICRWVGWYERGVFKEPNVRTIKEILGWLVENSMIEIYPNESNSQGTHYKVLGYDVYQGEELPKVTESKQSVNSQYTVTTTKQECIRMIKNEKKEDQDRKTEEVPYQKVVDLYHEFCPGLSKVIKLNTNRKTLIRARFKNHGLDGLEILFKKAGASNFLQGINDRAWKANFDWLLKDSNAIKVLEGNYDNRTSPTAEKRSREDFVYTEPPKQDLSKFSFLEEDNHE